MRRPRLRRCRARPPPPRRHRRRSPEASTPTLIDALAPERRDGSPRPSGRTPSASTIVPTAAPSTATATVTLPGAPFTSSQGGIGAEAADIGRGADRHRAAPRPGPVKARRPAARRPRWAWRRQAAPVCLGDQRLGYDMVRGPGRGECGEGGSSSSGRSRRSARIDATRARPKVSVPVLSRMTVRTRRAPRARRRS